MGMDGDASAPEAITDIGDARSGRDRNPEVTGSRRA